MTSRLHGPVGSVGLGSLSCLFTVIGLVMLHARVTWNAHESRRCRCSPG